MRDAYERMPETFLDWMLECPVPWICIKINKNTVHYSFDAPYEYEEEEEEAQASFVLVRELAALEALQAKQKRPHAWLH